MRPYDALGLLQALLVQAECADESTGLYVSDGEVNKLLAYASTMQDSNPGSTAAERQAWVNEVTCMHEYAWKIVCGRRVLLLVKRGASLPPVSLTHVCRRLEAMPNFSAVLAWLFQDVSPHFVQHVNMHATNTMPALLSNAIQPLYETLPPWYVPRKEEVTQELLNWWAHKLSTPQ